MSLGKLDTNTPENDPSVNQYHKKVADKMGNVIESENMARLKTILSSLVSNLETVTGNDLAEFRSSLSGLNMTDEEAQSVEAAISILLMMRTPRSAEDKKLILERFAKTSKVIDVAIANKVFKRLSYDKTSLENKTNLLLSASGWLLDAISIVSNKYDVQEAVAISGAVISGKELEEAIARAKTITIE